MLHPIPQVTPMLLLLERLHPSLRLRLLWNRWGPTLVFSLL